MRGLSFDLLPPVDDASAKLGAVARNEDQRLALRKQENRVLLAVLRVTVGVLKIEDTPFAMQFGQQRARLCAAARAALQIRP